MLYFKFFYVYLISCIPFFNLFIILSTAIIFPAMSVENCNFLIKRWIWFSWCTHTTHLLIKRVDTFNLHIYKFTSCHYCIILKYVFCFHQLALVWSILGAFKKRFIMLHRKCILNVKMIGLDLWSCKGSKLFPVWSVQIEKTRITMHVLQVWSPSARLDQFQSF
jgi:hypothetical protein